MSVDTPKSAGHFHPPYSNDLPLDTKLELSKEEILETIIGDEIAKVRKSSSNRHPLDYVPKYPAPNVLALFANLAYKEEEEIPKLIDADRWQLLTTAKSPEGYFGACFWHPENHQIVIAHRGTDFHQIWRDIIQNDIRGVYFNNYMDRISSAATFAEKILTIFDRVEKKLDKDANFSLQVFFTGHSLGGWLAQTTTFTTEYLRPMKNSKGIFLFQNPSKSEIQTNKLEAWRYHAHTVVFESPGCAGMLEKLQKKFAISSRKYSKDLRVLDITNYLSAPNIVNTCNEHIGPYYRLITDLSELNNDKSRLRKLIDYLKTLGNCIIHPTQIPDVIFKYTFITHSKEKIKELLDELAEKSHDEAKKKLKRILDWPTLDLPRRKEYNKLFEGDLLNWANSYHLDPEGNEYLDENGHMVFRYQTEDFDKLSGHLSMFTESEQQFLERYVWIRDSGLSIFRPDGWFKCLENPHQESRAKKLLESFLIENNKFSLNGEVLPNEFAPFVRRLLQLYSSIDNDTKEGLTGKYIIRKIFQFEAQNYRTNFERKSTSLDVKDDRFGVLITNFLIEKKRIWRAIVPEATQNGKFSMTLTYEALKKIFQLGTTESQCTILKLERFLSVMQHEIEVQYIFEDAKHLLIIDCEDFELNDADQKLLGKLLLVVKNNDNVKLILVSSNKQEETIRSLKDTHHLDNFYVEETLPSLDWGNLAPEYKQMLLGKSIRLAGSSDKITLLNLLGSDPFLELETDAMMQLIESKNVMDIGHEPQRLSDSEAAYAKCFELINQSHLLRALIAKENVDTWFVISGLDPATPETLIEKLRGIDNKNKEDIEARICKKIRLESEGYSEQKFRKFCHDHPTEQIHWISYETASNEWFWKLRNDPKFYIERELNLIAVPEAIRLKLLDEKAKECFAVSGTDSEQLLKFLDLENEGEIGSRLSIVEGNALFDNDHSTHLLVAEKINGKIRRLIRRLPATSKCKEKNEFATLEKEPISIVNDHPGMGKSTTLTRLTERRLNQNWVLRLNLKDCSKLPVVRNIDQVIEYIWSASGGDVTASLAKAIFRYHLKNPKADARPLLLLFDGYDEIIDRDQFDKIITLLRLLRTEFESSKHQVVIATRRHPQLEKDLQMLYTLEFTSFDRPRQIQFLIDFWLRQSELLIYDFDSAPAKSELYAKKLLEKVDETLGERMASFVGIPLQLRLLAEGFRRLYINFVNSSDYEPVFKSIGILDMYQFFINAKFCLLFQEKTGFSEISCLVYEKWVREKLTNIHQHLARSILFSEKENKLFHDHSPQDDEFLELYRLGLIQKIRHKDEFEFIHFTFTEYHVAMFLMRKLPKFAGSLSPNESAMNFFINNILRMSKYAVVRSFLNKMLATHGDMTDLQKHSKLNGRIFFHVAAYEGNSEIIKLLFKVIETAKLNDLLSLMPDCSDFSGQTPLHIAAENGHSVTLAVLLAYFEEEEKNQTENFAINAGDKRQRTPLHLAAEKGHYDVVETLLRFKNVDVDAHGEILNETPLFSAAEGGHLNITRLLSKNNAKVDVGKSPLHVAAMHGYLEVVKEYLEGNSKGLVTGSNIEKLNSIHCPLHAAAGSGCTEVIDFLLRVEGIDVNARDSRGRTPLYSAVAYNKIEAVRTLLRAENIDVNLKSGRQCVETPLQTAVKCGNVEIAQLLLDNCANGTDEDIESARRVRKKIDLLELLPYLSYDVPLKREIMSNRSNIGDYHARIQKMHISERLKWEKLLELIGEMSEDELRTTTSGIFQ